MGSNQSRLQHEPGVEPDRDTHSPYYALDLSMRYGLQEINLQDIFASQRL